MNNTSFYIREADINDIYEIRKCNKSSLIIYYPYNIYKLFINNSNKIVLVSHINENICGYIMGEHKNKTNKFHIFSFAVYKKYRRNKIGTNLINKIIDLSLKRYDGIKNISLYVMLSNKEAISFYEKNGFTKNKLIKDYYSSGSDAYVYTKNIL